MQLHSDQPLTDTHRLGSSSMKTKNTALIILAFVAFISLGLPDGLLGVAWPGIRRHFGLPVDALGLFLVFSTTGYMTSSFFSGALVRRLGLGGLLAASCAATGLALGIYSVTPAWWVFVGFGLLGGFGAGAIDAGLNNYIDRNHSERLMQWLHASFGVGITMGPAIMTTGLSLTGRWQPGYRVVAVAQLGLAAAFLATRKLWERGAGSAATPADGHVRTSADGGRQSDAAAGIHHVGLGAGDLVATGEGGGHRSDEATICQSAMHLPSLVGVLLFFTYTGAELGLGIWAYTLLTESRGVDPVVAGIITGGYWASFTVGRILAGIFGARIGSQRMVGVAIALAAVSVAIVWLDLGPVLSAAGIALTGFVIAPVFPGLVSDTRNRVDRRHLTNTVGMQIAGAGLGAAVLPALTGVVARVFGAEAMLVFLFGVIVLLLLLFVGARVALARAQFSE